MFSWQTVEKKVRDFPIRPKTGSEIVAIALVKNLKYGEAYLRNLGPSGFSAGPFPPQGPKPDRLSLRKPTIRQTAQQPLLKGGFMVFVYPLKSRKDRNL